MSFKIFVLVSLAAFTMASSEFLAAERFLQSMTLYNMTSTMTCTGTNYTIDSCSKYGLSCCGNIKKGTTLLSGTSTLCLPEVLHNLTINGHTFKCNYEPVRTNCSASSSCSSACCQKAISYGGFGVSTYTGSISQSYCAANKTGAGNTTIYYAPISSTNNAAAQVWESTECVVDPVEEPKSGTFGVYVKATVAIALSFLAMMLY